MGWLFWIDMNPPPPVLRSSVLAGGVCEAAEAEVAAAGVVDVHAAAAGHGPLRGWQRGGSERLLLLPLALLAPLG